MSKMYLEGFASEKYGLLGEKLSHSFSPQIHRELSDYEYKLYEVRSEKLGSFMKNNDLKGFNVTIPYKEKVIEYLDDISERAREIGAVNTVVKRDDGTYFGDNTDYDGFLTMLSELSLDLKGKKTLVLGSGGASKTAVCVLSSLGAEVVVISRKGDNNYDNIEMHKDASLIVNATPVGMYPKVGESPVDISIFENLEGVCDLIYNPLKTELIIMAEERGIKAVNGLSMLVSQAKRAAEIFTDESICDSVIDSIREKITKQTQNVVLIGMPGCGKSTVGKILAEKLERQFEDTDRNITELSGRTPSEIIRSEGEKVFREIESVEVMRLSKESGLVIATGGGVVTVEGNHRYLCQNSLCVFINKDISALATEDRPLSKNLHELYRERLPLYKSFADAEVDGNADAETVSERILEVIREENI